jgi:hypothetical protein
MSIANLTGGSNFPIVINDLKVKTIDTPTALDNLLIGPVNANSVIIAKLSSSTIVKGPLLTNHIDVDSTQGSTLFIGAEPQTLNMQLGRTGFPVTALGGVITPGITRGGSVGAGTLDIGGNLANTAITVGNTAAPITLLANSLTFPSTTLTPLSITESLQSFSAVIPYTGGINNVNGCRVNISRFGDLVTVDIVNLIPAGNPSALGTPVVINALPVGYRPATERVYVGMLFSSGQLAPGQVHIFPNGAITVFDFISGGVVNGCQLQSYSYTFNVNL